MAIAALILSVVAVLVAGASAWWTRKQANAAADVRDTDADRRHAERSPRFSVATSRSGDTGHTVPIRIEHNAVFDVFDVRVSVISPGALLSTYDVDTGLQSDEQPLGIDPLPQGHAAEMRLLINRALHRSSTSRLLIKSRDGRDGPEWSDVVEVDYYEVDRSIY